MSHSFEDALRIHALKTLLANLSMLADVREQVMKFAMNDGQGCNDATYLANIALSPEFCASYVFGTNKWNSENLLVFLQAAFRQCSEAPYVVGGLLETLDLVRGRSMGGTVGPPARGVTPGAHVGQQVSPHRAPAASGAANTTDSHAALTDAREDHHGYSVRRAQAHAQAQAHAHQQKRAAQPPGTTATPTGPSASASNPMYALAEATAARLQHGSPLHQQQGQGRGQHSMEGTSAGPGSTTAAGSLTASTQKLSAAVEELRHDRPSLGSGSKRPLPTGHAAAPPPPPPTTASKGAGTGGGGDWAVHAGGGRGSTPVTIPPRQAEAFPPGGTGSGSDGGAGGGGGVARKGGPANQPPVPGKGKGGSSSSSWPHGGHGGRAAASISRASTQVEEDGARPAKRSKVWGGAAPSPPPSPSPSPPRPGHAGLTGSRVGSARPGTATTTTSTHHLANGKPSAGMLGKAAWEYRREPPRCFATVCDKLCAAYSRAAEKRGQAKEAYLAKVVTTCVEALVEYLHEEGGSRDAEDQEWITRGKRWLALLQRHPHALTDVHTPGLWSTGAWPPDHVCGVYGVRKEDAAIPPVPRGLGASSSSSAVSASDGADADADAGAVGTGRTASASPPPPPPPATSQAGPSSLPSLRLPAPPSRVNTGGGQSSVGADSVSSEVYRRARRALFGSRDLGSRQESPPPTNITTWLADFKERRMMNMAAASSSTGGSTGPPPEPEPGHGHGSAEGGQAEGGVPPREEEHTAPVEQ